MGADQTRSEASRWHSPTDGEEGKAVKATLPAFFFPTFSGPANSETSTNPANCPYAALYL